MAGRRTTTLAGAVIAALLASFIAGGALADKEQIALTKAGHKAARGAVLKRGDLGKGAWTGSAKRPALNTPTGCPGYAPKQSDLVVVGAAGANWKSKGVQFDSEAQVLRTPKMVQLDWKRTVRAAKVMPCLKRNLEQSLARNERLSFVTRLPVPRIPALVRLYRAVVVVRAKGVNTPILIDSLLIGSRRTEITLTTTALYASRKAVTRTEVRLARVLARRAR
jgi:hypothetical protein